MNDVDKDDRNDDNFDDLTPYDFYQGGNPPWKQSIDDVIYHDEVDELNQEYQEEDNILRSSYDSESDQKSTKKKKKRRKKNYLLRIVVVLAIIVGTCLFLSSDFFAINIISVENNQHYSDEEIIEMSGVIPGDNLLKVKKRKIQKALTEDNYIDAVQVTKDLPRILILTVEEREAVMSFSVDGKYVITDREGEVLEITDTPNGVTEIVGLKPIEYELGEIVVFDDPIRWKQILGLAQSMADSGMYFKKIEYAEPLMRAYVYDSLLFQGLQKSLITNMENIKVVLFDLNQKSIQRGVVTIGEDGYASFSPNIQTDSDQSIDAQINDLLGGSGLPKDTSKSEDDKTQDGDGDAGDSSGDDSEDGEKVKTGDGTSATGTEGENSGTKKVESFGELKDLIDHMAQDEKGKKSKNSN